MDIVNEDHCFSILKKCVDGEVNLVDYNLGPVSKDVVGLLGEHLRLTVTFSMTENNEVKVQRKHFFVKAMPKKMPELTKYLITTGMFEKERLLLRDLFPKLLKCSSVPWTAECYYSGKVIILEDLKAKNYDILNNDCYDYKRAKSVFETLARFHASSIIFEQLNGGRKIIDDYKEMLFETRHVNDKENPRYKFLRTTTNAILELLKLMPNYKPEYEVKYRETVRNMNDLAEPSEKYTNVVMHGDVWSNNIMFKEESNGKISSILVDFQMSRYSVPVGDLITFVYDSTDPDFRKKYLGKLLQIYCNTIRQELDRHGLDNVAGVSVAELEETWRIYCPMYLMGSAIIATEILLSQELLRPTVENEEAFLKFNFEDRSKILCKAFREDRVYRERVTDILNEIINWILV